MREKLLHERASFLRDAVFSASDGVITTFAVVAGSQGASLSSEIVLILGFANLLADGFSMASGTFMGVKSEAEFEKASGDSHPPDASPIKQALVTFFAFDIAGLLPLLPFVFWRGDMFFVSVVSVIASMFLIGALKAKFTKKSVFASALEMVVIGGLAALMAFLVGFVIDKYLL